MMIPLDQIASAAALACGASFAQMRGDVRTTEVLRARRIFAGLVREFTGYSYPEIAAWYGPSWLPPGGRRRRSHSTTHGHHEAHHQHFAACPVYRDAYDRAAAQVREMTQGDRQWKAA